MALLGNLTGSSQFFNDTAFYNGAVSSSLRMQDARLTETPGSTGNSKKWTFSAWIKRGTLADSYIFAGTPYDGYNGIAAIYFTAAGQLHTYYDTSGANPYGAVGSRLFRDTSSWYHLVWAVDAANTIHKIWINNELVSTDTGKYPPNYDYGINRSGSEMVIGDGSWDSYGSTNFNGYMAEINHCDGQYLEPDSFGETKNGVWIPLKDPSLTYGTNGFRLQFLQTGTSANSSGIGADTSGQANHFAVNALAASDVVPDSPENNFATWNALFKGGEQSSSIYANSTLSNGNLEVSVPTNSYMGNTFRPISGKWYCEFRVKTVGSTNGEIDWGWIQATTYAGTTAHSGQANKWGAYYHAYSTDHIQIYDETSQLGSNINLTISAGSVLQLAWDIDNNKGWVGINNTYYAADNGTDGNPSAGTNQTFTFTDDEAQNLQCYIANGTGTDVHVANFGQDSTFGGAVSAGGNADGNGIGDFAYAPPTGFLALCTANLPEPTIGSNSATQADDHFNTVLYTGNASPATHTLGFRPNWVWGKRRASNAQNHWWINDVTDIDKFISSDTTDAEATTAGTTFNATSFTTANNDLYINSGSTYVVWAWKGNGTGTAVSNTDGSINSTVSANTTAGFSIVSYTGTGANATVGHGLGVAPRMIIMKRRDSAQNWVVYHEDIGNNRQIFLNLTNAQTGTNSVYFNNTSPTTSVFSLGSDDYANASSGTYVAYCFAEIESYSRIGSYTGNGNADGAFVFLGLKPSFILIKRTDTAEDWWIYDNKRDTFNPNTQIIYANDDNAEITGTGDNISNDFVSNGIKLRTANVNWNASGGTYIYMAFGDSFKYANAR